MTPAATLDSSGQSRVLMQWLAGRPSGGFDRAGVSNLTALSSDAEAMRALFQPLPSSSGFAVTDYTAMLVSTLYRCLSTIAGAWMQLPVHQYRMLANDGRESMGQTPLWWLLNESPDDAWTAASWREWIVRCVHMRGDQHTEIIRKAGASSAGAIQSLLPHHPDNVRPRRDGRRIVYDVFDPATGKSRGVDQDDMLHFAGFGFDGLKSLSVVQHAARNSIGNALAASDFTGRQLGEGAMPKIALKYPNKLSPEQAKLLRESFVAAYSGPGSQKLPLLMTEGGEAQPLTWNAVDLELLASRRFEREDICQACGVPPVLIGENDKTSSWGTGVEQITLGFVKYTIKPHLTRWSQEMNRKLFRRAGQFIEHDLDELLAGDSKAQGEFFRSALGGPGSGDGWISVNQVRRRKNMPPLEGEEYDKPFRAQRAGDKAAAPAPDAAAEAAQAASAAAAGASRDMAAAITLIAQREPQAAQVNVGAPVVNVAWPEQPAPIVNVAAAEAPVVNIAAAEAPIVNVTVPDAHVHVEAVMPAQAAPVVNVTLPEQPAPQVHVSNQVEAPTVTVRLPDRRTETTISRDQRGNIVSAVQLETDAQEEEDN